MMPVRLMAPVLLALANEREVLRGIPLTIERHFGLYHVDRTRKGAMRR